MLRRSPIFREAFGFIGLGQMGARMAPLAFKNPAVTKLVIFDANAAAMEQVRATAVANGIAADKVVFATSPARVAEAAKTIVTMLPNGKIVGDVYRNPDTGIFSKVQRGAVLLDSSTIDPATSKALNEAALQLGAEFFDAPVSGGVMAAAAGTLTFMVGAAPDAFARAEAALKPFAKSVVHCGAAGSGQVCKLCNNLILAQHMVAVSEAMLLGTRLGVDPKTLAGIFNTSTGRCWSGDTYNPFPGVLPNVPSSNGYKGGFGASLMLKDLNLALDAAKTANLVTAGATNARDVYAEMVGPAKMGDLDFSGVLKHIDGKSK